MLRSAFSPLLALGLLLPTLSMAQADGPGTKKAYWTSSGEWIFSTPILDVKGVDQNGNETSSDEGAVIRFSPFFNAQGMVNYDLSEHFGLFSGLSIRNQGFIYKVPNDSVDVRYKFRTYNIGIPVGLKVGNMNRGLVYFGYELEFPFNYKEKEIISEKKDKFNVWFSDRTEKLFQSVFLGFQGPGRTNLTVRYYLTNFHNKDFQETENGVTTKPYAGFNVNLLTFSLGYALFDATKGLSREMGADQTPRAIR